MICSSLTRFAPTPRGRARPAIAAACACALAPAIAQSQDRLGRDPSAILEYESATAGYRSLEDGTAEPADANASAGAPDAAMAEPARDPVEVGVTPVPAPVEKLRESTEPRRGMEPAGDPEDVPASRRPAIGYESAMDAYEMFEEGDGPDWVEANDEVGRIGGWKTYAREIYESASGDELNDGDQE